MSANWYLYVNLIISVLMLIVVMVANYYKKKKNNENVDIMEYLSSYSDKIINVMKQVIETLKLTQETYHENEEEIKKIVIESTINTLIDYSAELDIDLKILTSVDRATLSGVIYYLIERELPSMIDNTKEKDTEITEDNTVEPVSPKSITDNTVSINNTLNNFYNEDNSTTDV